MFVQSITALMIASLLTAQNPVQNLARCAACAANSCAARAAKLGAARRIHHHGAGGNGDPAYVDESRQEQIDQARGFSARGGCVSGYGGIAARHSHGNFRGRDRNPGERAAAEKPDANATRSLHAVALCERLFGGAEWRKYAGLLTARRKPGVNRGSGGVNADALSGRDVLPWVRDQPTLPPLPQVGPSKAVVIGSMTGGFAAFTITMFALERHRMNSYDFVVFDVGWQFQMVLDSPVVLDAAQVAAAASRSQHKLTSGWTQLTSG